MKLQSTFSGKTQPGFSVVPGLAAFIASFLVACAAPPDPSSIPKFSMQEFRIGGAGGWDFLAFDTPGQRLFISRGDRVQVWSASEHRLVGEIAPTEGVHGIALAPQLNRGFTSNGRGNSVTEFELTSLKVLRTVPVTGVNPDAIIYEPVFNRLYAFNGRSRDVSILDARTLEVVSTIPLGGKPEVGASDETGRVFVNIEDTAEIVALDPVTVRVAARWPIRFCEEPTGLAIDVARGHLFTVCANHRMLVVDSKTGAVLSPAPIDAEPDGAAFDPGLGAAYSSNGAGTLTMVRADAQGHYAPAATITTRPRARTLALDPSTHRIYLVTADFGAAPAPTAQNPKPRPPMVADSFRILVVGPQ